MNHTMATLAVLLGLTLASCSENAPPAANNNAPTMAKNARLMGASPTVVSSSPGVISEPNGMTATTVMPPARPALKQDVVVPPKDAEWTILCTTVSGSGHVEQARSIKSQFSQAIGDRNLWYVVHGEEESTVYYGFYKEIDRATRDGAKAQEEHLKLQGVSDAFGQHPLAGCYFTRLDAQEAEDFPQWNLANFPRSQERYWSLQFAAFENDRGRKQAAVEAVKAWRKQGVEAYYYHGPQVSSVCVGMWSYSAVREQTGGNLSGSAGSVDPTQPLIVSDIPLSEQMQRRAVTKDGRQAKAMAPKLEIVDPSLLAATRRFATHSVNGYEIQRTVQNPKTGRKEQMLDPSFLILVPEMKAGNVAGGRQENNTAWLNAVPDAQQPALQPAPQLPGVGRLRSSGE